MNLKLVKEVDAPLLSRKRLSFELDYPGSHTPSRMDIRKMIASSQKVKEELVTVRHVYPRFGECKAKIIAHVYDNVDDLKKHEPKLRTESSRKTSEEKKEVKKEEPKQEVKKEETKQEEKSDAKEKSEEQKAE